MDNQKENTLTGVSAQPKEAEDLLDRLANQNGHLDDIRCRLGRLQDRLDGCVPQEADNGVAGTVGDGLLPRFNEAMSVNMTLVSQIDELVKRLERVA